MTNPFELDCAGMILRLDKPVVMGILNVTPDSFYDGGSYINRTDQLRQAEKMIGDGAAIIDIGAVSTRPGSSHIAEKEEIERLIPAITAVKAHFADVVVSIDTYSTNVAKAAIEHGAMMINDVFGGRYDGKMFNLVAGHNIPYVMMHMQGQPDNMQINPHYDDVVEEVKDFFTSRLAKINAGFNQVILDPGFGFGKTVEQNFMLLQSFESLHSLGFPLLAGLSRKSMITRVLHINPADALNATTVLNTIALLKGANILRVHDVKEAVEAVKLTEALK